MFFEATGVATQPIEEHSTSTATAAVQRFVT